MTESVRAVKTWVQIGSLTVDGFMLPDGSYRTQPNTGSKMRGVIRKKRQLFFLSYSLSALPRCRHSRAIKTKRGNKKKTNTQ
jgi:hypothetical protein